MRCSPLNGGDVPASARHFSASAARGDISIHHQLVRSGGRASAMKTSTSAGVGGAGAGSARTPPRRDPSVGGDRPSGDIRARAVRRNRRSAMNAGRSGLPLVPTARAHAPCAGGGGFETGTSASRTPDPPPTHSLSNSFCGAAVNVLCRRPGASAPRRRQRGTRGRDDLALIGSCRGGRSAWPCSQGTIAVRAKGRAVVTPCASPGVTLEARLGHDRADVRGFFFFLFLKATPAAGRLGRTRRTRGGGNSTMPAARPTRPKAKPSRAFLGSFGTFSSPKYAPRWQGVGFPCLVIGKWRFFAGRAAWPAAPSIRLNHFTPLPRRHPPRKSAYIARKAGGAGGCETALLFFATASYYVAKSVPGCFYIRVKSLRTRLNQGPISIRDLCGDGRSRGTPPMVDSGGGGPGVRRRARPGRVMRQSHTTHPRSCADARSPKGWSRSGP